MIEFLYSLDVSVFRFINDTLSNPLGDFLWPLITDYDKLLPVRIVLAGVWLLLLIRGGRTGRVVALLLIPVIFFADTISSKVIKELVGRARPCHELERLVQVENIHLLVNCGSGKSFPSSHAVNNFAVATVFGFFYRRWLWGFVAWASIVALSRPAVGVHYPSDIIAGAVLGTCIAFVLIHAWLFVDRRFLESNTTSSSKEGPQQ